MRFPLLYQYESWQSDCYIAIIPDLCFHLKHVESFWFPKTNEINTGAKAIPPCENGRGDCVIVCHLNLGFCDLFSFDVSPHGG